MKTIAYAAGFAVSSIFLFSCGDAGKQADQNNSGHDSDSVKVVVKQDGPQKVKGNYDRLYNDIGRYLAGMGPENGSKLDTALYSNKDWKLYAEGAEKNWHKYDSSRIQVLKKWSAQELADVNRGGTLFYPFSGPDILHANCFFDKADTTVMIGLEPVGSMPFVQKNEADTIGKYFRSVNSSLYAILNFSFFRTVAMKTDLRSEVNGTIPLMMIFLERTGNRVLDVNYIHVDTNGKVVNDAKEKYASKIPGVQITYCKSDSTEPATLMYFSTDLSNGGLQKSSKEFVTFIHSLGTVNTYLKSASFLMHEDFFSEIRSAILAQSRNVLQDDSGIPNRFFNGWSHTLYGSYTGVIPLFKGNFQRDLDSIYKHDTTNVRPLEFGIGYKWHKGQSNLVLYRKDPAKA